MTNTRVTMKQIAEHAGVSQPTVSFVLNGKDRDQKISAETRRRVLAAAEKLGYRVHAGARATASGRFDTVALAMGESVYLPPYFLRRLQVAASDRGQSLALAYMPDSRLGDAAGAPKILTELRVDGLLLNHVGTMPKQVARALKRFEVPTVWVNAKRDCDCVHPDDLRAATTATRDLIARGHRRIAYASFRHEPHGHYSLGDRLRGYERAMADAGLKPTVLRARDDAPPEQKLSRAVRALSSKERPTAVLAYSWESIAPVCAAACAVGLTVPRDLSLLTIGEEAFVHMGVPVDAMVLPWGDVADAAVDMLLKKIEQPGRTRPGIALGYDVIQDVGSRAGPSRSGE